MVRVMTDRIGAVSRTLWARGGKRAFDVVGAALLIVLTLPIWLTAAVLVKVTSKGPVFFSQDRSGRDGAIFRPRKFRTMRGGRKPDAKELVPLDHPEITPVGRWLRRLKIDEMPQLLDVMTGEMSLVGPRPTLPDQVAAYDDFRRQRLLLRPGLSGLAQVHSPASRTWDERILYDVAYVRRCSLLLDMYILLRTILVIVLGEERTARPFPKTRFAKHVTIPPDFDLEGTAVSSAHQ